jgi:hypothetical protein
MKEPGYVARAAKAPKTTKTLFTANFAGKSYKPQQCREAVCFSPKTLFQAPLLKTNQKNPRGERGRINSFWFCKAVTMLSPFTPKAQNGYNLNILLQNLQFIPSV